MYQASVIQPEHFNDLPNSSGKNEPKVMIARINIAKNVSVPQKKKVPFLPYNLESQDWQLTLRDQDGEMKLVDGISIWY